jgi:hypothetical protein
MTDNAAIQPDQHIVATTFFVGLHKSAAPNVREQARNALRAVVETTKAPATVKKLKVKAPTTTAVKAAKPLTSAQLKSQLTIRLKKQAFVGGLLRNIGHYGQRALNAAKPEIEAAIASARAGGGKALKGVKDSTTGFRDGFQAEKGSAWDLAKEKVRAAAKDHKAGKSWTETAKEMARGGSKKHVGSKRHYEQMVKKKGQRYADAHRLGMTSKTTVDPKSSANAARHFADSSGNINPLTIFSGLHSTGIVSPEATSRLASRVMKRKAKPFELKNMTDSQKVMGGATLGGLGYLAIRRRNPNPSTADV